MPNASFCSIQGCDRVSICKGYCNTHYRRIQRNTLTPLDKPIRPKAEDGDSLYVTLTTIRLSKDGYARLLGEAVEQGNSIYTQLRVLVDEWAEAKRKQDKKHR